MIPQRLRPTQPLCDSSDDVDGTFNEVNCSLAPTAWLLRLYDSMQSLAGEGAPSIRWAHGAPTDRRDRLRSLRAGQPVNLFQKVIEGYLVAELPQVEALSSPRLQSGADFAGM